MAERTQEEPKVRFDFLASAWIRKAVDWAVFRRRFDTGEPAFLRDWLEEACIEKLQRDHPGRFDGYLEGHTSLEDALKDKPTKRRGAK